MRTSEVLNKAADLVQVQGWTSGAWGDGDGPLCMEGAIAAARGASTEDERVLMRYCPAATAVRDYLDGEIPFLWNDRLAHNRIMAMIGDAEDRRTFEEKTAQAEAEAAAEVIEVLRAAAVIEAAKESDRELIEVAS